MPREERQQSWSEFLDLEKENLLFVRFSFSSDFSEVESLAVIYLALVGEQAFEVVRFDCSLGEAVHVHRFFGANEEKKYLARQKSFETLAEFVADIRANWRLYRAEFLEKSGNII
jgi:hypothetical protein